jgi:hypothetical protein
MQHLEQPSLAPPRRRCALLGLALAALLASISSPAPAQADEAPVPVALELRYSRPPGNLCPDESALHQEVARRMGYDPFTHGAADLLVATTARNGAGLTSTVALFDAKGARRWTKEFAIRDDRCAALITAMGNHIAYVFAASIRPVQASPPAQPPPPLPPSPPPLLLPPQPSSLPPSPRFEIGISPLLALGTAPAPAFGLRLQAGARWRPFSIAAELRWDAPVSAAAESPPGARIETTLLGGSLLPCGHISYFTGCAVVTAGQMSGEGAGLSAPKKDANAYLGAGVRAAFELHFTDNIGARLFAEGLASIRNVRIVLDGGEVWRTTPITGSMGGTVVALF